MLLRSVGSQFEIRYLIYPAKTSLEAGEKAETRKKRQLHVNTIICFDVTCQTCVQIHIQAERERRQEKERQHKFVD